VTTELQDIVNGLADDAHALDERFEVGGSPIYGFEADGASAATLRDALYARLAETGSGLPL
jgi:hypothetical protein